MRVLIIYGAIFRRMTASGYAIRLVGICINVANFFSFKAIGAGLLARFICRSFL